MRPIRLRDSLRPDDRDTIAAILEEAGVFRPEEVAVGLELVDETLDAGPRSSYLWMVAESAGTECDDAGREGEIGTALLGFACYGAVPLTDATFDLYWIAVHPRAAGQGIATRIEEAVALAVRRAGGRWLLAETSSTPPYEPARRFYRRRGYALLETIPDFYRPGDGRMTFGKRLDRDVAGFG